MIKKIIILIISAYAISLSSAQNEIEISRCSVSELSPSEFSLIYSIKNNFDAGSYSNIQVTLPFEQYIFQGSLDSGFLNEKDFLFSQTDVDLNGDSDFSDLFKAKIIKNQLVVHNKKISPVYKTTSNYQVFMPLDENGNYNISRITEKGQSFVLKHCTTANPEVIIGLNPAGDIEFRKFTNSLILIEVINSDKNIIEKTVIDGQKPFTGITNEKELTGGENSYRSAAVKNISINNDIASGEIKIKDIRKPFSVRVTYYFALTGNLILLNQKIVKVN